MVETCKTGVQESTDSYQSIQEINQALDKVDGIDLINSENMRGQISGDLKLEELVKMEELAKEYIEKEDDYVGNFVGESREGLNDGKSDLYFSEDELAEMNAKRLSLLGKYPRAVHDKKKQGAAEKNLYSMDFFDYYKKELVKKYGRIDLPTGVTGTKIDFETVDMSAISQGLYDGEQLIELEKRQEAYVEINKLIEKLETTNGRKKGDWLYFIGGGTYPTSLNKVLTLTGYLPKKKDGEIPKHFTTETRNAINNLLFYSDSSIMAKINEDLDTSDGSTGKYTLSIQKKEKSLEFDVLLEIRESLRYYTMLSGPQLKILNLSREVSKIEYNNNSAPGNLKFKAKYKNKIDKDSDSPGMFKEVDGKVVINGSDSLDGGLGLSSENKKNDITIDKNLSVCEYKSLSQFEDSADELRNMTQYFYKKREKHRLF